MKITSEELSQAYRLVAMSNAEDESEDGVLRQLTKGDNNRVVNAFMRKRAREYAQKLCDILNGRNLVYRTNEYDSETIRSSEKGNIRVFSMSRGAVGAVEDTVWVDGDFTPIRFYSSVTPLPKLRCEFVFGEGVFVETSFGYDFDLSDGENFYTPAVSSRGVIRPGFYPALFSLSRPFAK